jgi:uncharacterized protein YlxP (DUF503 family)
MVVAIALFEFHLPQSRGLKEKRAFVRPLKTRLRTEFAVSAAEVGHQDLLQRAALGVAAVGADAEALEPLFEKIVAFVERTAEDEGVELAAIRRELLEYGDVSAPGSHFGAGEAPEEEP